uniref:Uncharacterized protein n=1 Tax=Ditylenchus dipsaci TaxID=166011 RepID=A0A915EMW9_9BILA
MAWRRSRTRRMTRSMSTNRNSNNRNSSVVPVQVLTAAEPRVVASEERIGRSRTARPTANSSAVRINEEQQPVEQPSTQEESDGKQADNGSESDDHSGTDEGSGTNNDSEESNRKKGRPNP